MFKFILLNLAAYLIFFPLLGLHASLETNEWNYKELHDVPYQNWKKGFPRLPVNGEMKHRCVLVRASGHWINKHCDLHDHSYICSIPKNLS